MDSEIASCAKNDNELWSAETANFRINDNAVNEINIRIRSDEFLRQFDFVGIPFEVGEYELVYSTEFQQNTKEPNVRMSCVDYDAFFCLYGLKSDAIPAIITIDEISADSKEVKGTFQAGFDLETLGLTDLKQETIFEEGRFIAVFVE